MSFYARPQPLTPAAELARIDNDLRVQSWRLTHAHLNHDEERIVRAVIDRYLDRRHNLTTEEQP